MTTKPRKSLGIYARMYVSMLRNAKLIERSDLAWRLYGSSILWCRDEGNDGRVPTSALLACVPGKPKAKLLVAAAELADAGLWVANGDGWHIHDYGTHQDTAEKIAANRQIKRAAAQTRWAEEPDPEPDP